MALYTETIIVSLNVSDGFIDKAKIDTRLTARQRTAMTRIETKIGASTNLSNRECLFLIGCFSKLMTATMKDHQTAVAQ